MLLQFLAKFDVLVFDLVQFRFQFECVQLDGSSKVFLEIVDGIIGFIAFLVETYKGTGEVVDDSCFFEVLSELLLFAFGGLRVARVT